jgi:hypothetical protein
MTTYCANHPDVETGLRCNRCNKYICAKCAVRTPTGYRCQECIREQKKVFDTAQPQDYLLGFITAAALAFVGSLVIGFLGFFTLFLSPMVGMLIANIVQGVIRKRRSPALFTTLTAGVVIGGLATNIPTIFAIFVYQHIALLGALLWPGIYVFLAASTFYARISGIQLR